MSAEPTLGEVFRRLDEVSRQLAALADQMAKDRVAAEVVYVRKDVYGAETLALTTRVGKIEQDDEIRDRDAAAFRRQVFFIVLGSALPAIAGLLLAVNNFLAAGGRT